MTYQKEQNISEQNLVNALSYLFKCQISTEFISYHVLMLSDLLYHKLFEHTAQLLQISEYQVRNQFNQLVLKYFNKSQLQLRSNDTKRQCCYNLQENHPRTQSSSSIQFQNMYSQCLQKVTQFNESDNKKLCQQVITYLQNNDSFLFWQQMHQLIPEKTTVQLREYFQNSFKRFMHQEYLIQEDKLILKEMINRTKDGKPSEIADRFMEMTKEKNYFKRNVVMYIANLQNKQKQ
ncbi:Hypothetical_protein [Hexamita inflata]|uniref:Hypothetical_protein n=1 Tax=Hexamita inflata TaxID=28002 RepID=A0AA86R9S5_9EUKA|nr:Hypothetical protein HINF_LOCUS62119 [Hexamita inflata]